MVKYVLKKIAWFMPTIFFVTLICFILLKKMPGSPINSLINMSGSLANVSVQKKFWETKLELNLPLFYFNVIPLSNVSQNTINTSSIKNYIPCLKWYGLNNQYHNWLFGGPYSKGILRGDFGISYLTQEPVIDVIKYKIGWSLFFAITSILLTYAISIPLGIKFATNPHSKFTKRTEKFLFLMYAMPPFFIGVLLLMVFANPSFINIFPPSGVKPTEGFNNSHSFIYKVLNTLPYLILPLITYTYSSFAFLSKLTSTAINQQLTFDYIKTAKAKGLNYNQIIWKHALKNSLIPIITVFSNVFPAVVGGSVIIESIFSIPGMGNQLLQSILAHDAPVIIAFVTITAILTMFSYFIADILNALIDPRLKNA